MAKVMTKSQVVSHLAEKAGIQKKAAAALLDELVGLATKECKSSGQFVIPGLGKAVKASRKARMGRNPQTGEPVKVPLKTIVKFRFSKSFKDAVAPGRIAASADADEVFSTLAKVFKKL
jgi:DNA-binding protein HU-beta